MDKVVSLKTQKSTGGRQIIYVRLLTRKMCFREFFVKEGICQKAFQFSEYTGPLFHFKMNERKARDRGQEAKLLSCHLRLKSLFNKCTKIACLPFSLHLSQRLMTPIQL